MKIEFDKEIDAAYIYLGENIEPGQASKTICINEDIILDFDLNNKLVGIEVLNATKNLSSIPKEIVK
ncbi:DUF2283 domain-containing protein [Candidatus Pacearchaeota archaeon]|nr:DUF2283 domain-containing protein [Candidatus Pacearchaeota archaeon]